MKKRYSPLIGAALAAASLFQFSLPAFSLGTEAGQEIRNRATATYDDDGQVYEAISNQVTVTVGKIAGITNVPGTFEDLTTTNNNILPGDTVAFNFEVTNTGNDTTDIYIPDYTFINTDNFIIGANSPEPNGGTSIRISTDGGTSFTDRPASGVIENVPEDTSIIVRVIGRVDPNANINDEVRVRLGDTGTNIADPSDPNFATTQNQLDNGGTGDDQNADVRTQTADPRPPNSTDPEDGATVAGEPVNNQREASATHIVSVGSNPLALTRVRKTNAGVDIGGTPGDLDDDVITYNLELDVLAQKLARYNDFNFNPAALEGRDFSTGNADTGEITGTGITDNTDNTNLILISDAIPAGTVLSENVTGNGNWTPVYTNDALTTAASAANWTTDAPADQAARNAVTRVGWVYNVNATGNGVIAAGTTVTAAQGGFTFRVRNTVEDGDTGIAGTQPVNVYNLAQVFGSTDDEATGVTAANNTFDESGDENPNNFNDLGTVRQDEIGVNESDINGGTDVNDDGDTGDTVFGYADPGANEDNVDTAGDNTETNSLGGEVNKVVVTIAAATADLLNGPDGAAQASGGIFGVTPDQDHDFQNQSAPIPQANDQISNGTEIAADTTITFTNTVRNTETGNLSDVILEPVTPDATLGLGGAQLDGNTATNNDFLPSGTLVTIRYDDQEVVFTYDGSGAYTAAVGANDTSGTGGAQGDDVVSIDTLNGTNAGNNEVDYTVIVTLPSGTELSTINNNGGYPVPIVAYVDNGTGAGSATGIDSTDTYNVTVDQVYLGYLRLTKDVRVLRDIDGDGNTDGNYTVVTGMDYTDDNDAKQPAPGDIIEYRVNYSNISEDQGSDDGGTGNVTLDAENVTITEDGTTADANNNGTIEASETSGNNWAVDNDGDSVMDTLHVAGEAEDSTGGAISYFSGNDGNIASNDNEERVTRYVNTIPLVAPGPGGAFTFQRKVTEPSDLDETP